MIRDYLENLEAFGSDDSEGEEDEVLADPTSTLH